MEDGGLDGSSPHTRGAHSRSDPLGGTRGIIPAYAGSTGLGRVPRADGRDHPRIRGEHSYVPERFGAGVGSSPHTRGAHPFDQGADDVLRIIPAYAGSTSRLSALNVKSPDHPRIRGEHTALAVWAAGKYGSSPHTRGALHRPGPALRRRPARHRRRIIPAYAGSTPCGTLILTEGRDHPRIRGEHVSKCGFCVLPGGSSPHTRGALRRRLRSSRSSRIIPAYAGSTSGWRRTMPFDRDHPRIRGEHMEPASDAQMEAGSSPHTRGAHDRVARRGKAAGIIPAYAGSTLSRVNESAIRQDHPRIRGEHFHADAERGEALGSSPHTRGARVRAGVGIGIARDHPRIRGEHISWAAHQVKITGSSPHTRGARDYCRSNPTCWRIIPAYAGSTLVPFL